MSNNKEGTIMGSGKGLMILIVILIVIGVTIAVMNHARMKPESPRQLAAAAFNQSFPAVNEWKPGMGPQPFIYHPAGFNSPTWQPLYACPLHGAGAPNFDAAGALHCPTCNQFMVLNR